MKTTIKRALLRLSTALSLLAAASACTRAADDASEAKSDGHRVGFLKGYEGINRVVRSRLIANDPNEPYSTLFEVGFMVDGSIQLQNTDGFRALLGSFQGAQGQITYQNGSPNAVNMLLWDLILSRMASSLATACAPAEAQLPYVRFTGGDGATRDLKLKPTTVARMTAVCAWPADDAGRRAALQSLWFGVMGFEAPGAELDAYLAAFGGDGSPVGALEPSERLRVLLRAMFLNPHFLLEV
jgi:hypothetical protein